MYQRGPNGGSFNPRVPGSIPGRPTGQPCSHLRLCTGCTSLLRREPPCGQQAANEWLTDGLADRSTQPHEVGREVVRLQLGPDAVEASMRGRLSRLSAVIAAVSDRPCESEICGGAVALALAGGVSRDTGVCRPLAGCRWSGRATIAGPASEAQLVVDTTCGRGE